MVVRPLPPFVEMGGVRQEMDWRLSCAASSPGTSSLDQEREAGTLSVAEHIVGNQ